MHNSISIRSVSAQKTDAVFKRVQESTVTTSQIIQEVHKQNSEAVKMFLETIEQ